MQEIGNLYLLLGISPSFSLGIRTGLAGGRRHVPERLKLFRLFGIYVLLRWSDGTRPTPEFLELSCQDIRHSLRAGCQIVRCLWVRRLVVQFTFGCFYV